MRQVFFDAWQRAKNKQLLEPLQALIVGIIEQHPEYHAIFENADSTLDKDFNPDMGETNPFLHLSMHLAIQEQIGSQRPHNIAELYQQLSTKCGDAHQAQHKIMECLSEMIWQAQKNQTEFDENIYLSCIQKQL
ncbi:MAG: DUF1841 family protein [Gammaproteobacteria bacterium]|nr:DUF1841 family protein [Gammaproteobacteria bacterium]